MEELGYKTRGGLEGEPLFTKKSPSRSLTRALNIYKRSGAKLPRTCASSQRSEESCDASQTLAHIPRVLSLSLAHRSSSSLFRTATYPHQIVTSFSLSLSISYSLSHLSFILSTLPICLSLFLSHDPTYLNQRIRRHDFAVSRLTSSPFSSHSHITPDLYIDSNTYIYIYILIY